jgi:hypothetical protein
LFTADLRKGVSADGARSTDVGGNVSTGAELPHGAQQTQTDATSPGAGATAGVSKDIKRWAVGKRRSGPGEVDETEQKMKAKKTKREAER